ncbi:alanine--glyoxylate aminotransferase family protein [Deferribacterales bacterium Es71-Z0220]|uniref:pyridoxal-phosphate-dependent aminotransferase family protein n=1 Tax=Deferrivibrio essentukiensis TaxID=2880922 RepID=UPI001F606D6E|nr:alanine--glyoxylate aminotransferase family protein [Deferrivibrio essentukiensis]MCB4205539.1 alanine--glyoxylate aminotransferase family protein [Deferrivibrio essentukiensis]
MLKKYLLAPGPTMVPERVLLDMAMPVIHHRTSEFSKIFSEAREKLKKVFGTKEDVLILASSGTAAMEAAVVNTLSVGDKVLVVNAGKFGLRWKEIATTFGLDVVSIDLEWGRSVTPYQIEEKLIEHPDIKAVLMQASETSTTVYHPVEEIAKIVSLRENMLLIVDGITSVGVVETKMDEWGVDIIVSGSQKAFMLPPGLSFIAMSKKAWKMAESSNIPKYYLNLKKELKSQQKDTTAWTPAVNLIIGLNTALGMMLDEGLENVYKRHAICAEATREAMKALGFELLAKNIPSNAATGIILPEDFDGGKFVKYMREDIGVTFAGGQDHLKGKIIRISHLGYHDIFDTIVAVSALELGFKKFGLDIEFGRGVGACQEVILKSIR